MAVSPEALVRLGCGSKASGCLCGLRARQRPGGPGGILSRIERIAAVIAGIVCQGLTFGLMGAGGAVNPGIRAGYRVLRASPGDENCDDAEIKRQKDF